MYLRPIMTGWKRSLLIHHLLLFETSPSCFNKSWLTGFWKKRIIITIRISCRDFKGDRGLVSHDYSWLMRQRLISIRHHEEAFMSIGTINFGEFYQLEKVINRTICNLFVLKLPHVSHVMLINTHLHLMKENTFS